MANIREQNPVRYTIDKLKSEAHALFIAKPGNTLDCTGASSVTGFNITYSQPQYTQIALAFSTGDQVMPSQMGNNGDDHAGSGDEQGAWFRLNSSGYAVLIDSQSISYESLIDEGNTVSELLALKSIPAFKGYNVRIAIALYSSDPKNALPCIKLELKCTNSSQTTQKIEYSPIYELGNNAQILNIITSSSIENNASVFTEGCIDDSGDWLPIENLTGMNAETLQLRVTLNAPNINSSTAKFNEANIIYSEGTGIISGEGTSEIISQTHNWYKPVKHCRCVIRHEPLKESSMKVYAAFRNQPSQVTGETLGTGDGKMHTYQLKQKNRIKFDTVKLFYDGMQTFGGFEVNGETARITCTPPAGVIVSCSYEYNWELEEWQELAFSSLTRKENYDESEYYIKNADSKAICAVKIALIMTSGSTANESIGRGMGREHSYKLAHKVKNNAITIKANNAALNKSNFYVLEDTQYVKIAAQNGQVLTASYDWISETPVIYDFHAVFSE